MNYSNVDSQQLVTSEWIETFSEVSPRLRMNRALTAQDRRTLETFQRYRKNLKSEFKGEGGVSDHLGKETPTEIISTQSFEDFYIALFEPQAHSSNPTDLGVQPDDPSQAMAGNPFSEAISELGREASSSHPVPAASADSATDNQSQPAGSQPANQGESAQGPQEPTPPDQPSNGADGTSTSQPTLGGAMKPSIVVGDLSGTGVAGISPGVQLEGNRFEFFRLGLLDLELSIIAAPNATMSTVAVDDLNGDEIADIALVNAFDDFVLVWLGLPGGGYTFAGASEIPAGGRSITTGDFNLDGIKDLAVVESSHQDIVDILAGNGGGRFNYLRTVQMPGPTDLIAVEDLDADGRQDLIGTNLSDFRAQVRFFTGPNLEVRKTSFSFLNLPSDQYITDINLNGRMDQVFLFQSGDQVSVVLNPARFDGIKTIANFNLRYPVILVLGDLLEAGFTDLGIATLHR